MAHNLIAVVLHLNTAFSPSTNKRRTIAFKCYRNICSGGSLLITISILPQGAQSRFKIRIEIIVYIEDNNCYIQLLVFRN